jgi:hypothetical protein
MRLVSNRNRPVHLGPFPLERVVRTSEAPDLARVRDSFPVASTTPLGRIVNEYIALFEQFRSEDPAPERAPYPKDSLRLANELKANCYFLNASLAACCEIPAAAWSGAPIDGHRHALAILVEFGRDPEPDNLAADWVRGSEYDCALLRAAEIALISAAFLRRLGFSATAHTRDRTESRMLPSSGVRARVRRPVSSFIGNGTHPARHDVRAPGGGPAARRGWQCPRRRPGLVAGGRRQRDLVGALAGVAPALRRQPLPHGEAQARAGNHHADPRG